MPYAQVTLGLQKAREFEAVAWEEEDRESTGKRYRYFVTDTWEAFVAKQSILDTYAEIQPDMEGIE